ncbi:uncharacterized protein FIBRA_07883 [Fibroporia radiculosa]|uniref:Major facilitator superfamily (MFS) profile domain-containing protein n=1 Tax=Fibroporia radiculosa TaxID=599839 RepID=J4GFT8_9APHY|nr:uncharacterized protein FIBRA_07883 [Fibroporia radiculosa]CCM05653.1 predicted protein [Fibroporia radiculosa]
MSARSSNTLAENKPQNQWHHADVPQDVGRDSSNRRVADAPIQAFGRDDTKRDQYQVTLDASEDPKAMSTCRKWVIVLVISSAALCATFASSIAAFTEEGLVEDLHTVHEVAILSVSLFVLGLGLGPLLVGPLSEVYGRNSIYRASYFFFWVFTWPVAFPPDIATFLVFRFISGFCSSAFLSVAGGSVSDLFTNDQVGSPMGVYTMSPFLGPALGPLIAGFICQNTDWRWTFRLLLIMQFVLIIMLLLFVPETYIPVVLKRKAAALRRSTGNDRYWAPLDRREGSLGHAILLSCYTPFQLIIFDRMALLLDMWNALVLGILYLTFQAYPIIYEDVHGFNMQDTGMAFLGLGIGILAALATQPLWNRFNRKQAEKFTGTPPPESCLIMGQVGGVMVSVSLFWLAFTTYKAVPWIVPIIASVPFGWGVYYIYTSTFTYLIVAYRPVAASAMAGNTAMRCSFAAAFPLFAGQMYDTLGTVGATALLAGLMTLMMPLPTTPRTSIETLPAANAEKHGYGESPVLLPGPKSQSKDEEAGNPSPFPTIIPTRLDEYQVTLDPNEDPQNISTFRKWVIVLIIASAALCTSFASSAAAFTEEGVAKDLHTVHEVSILSISLSIEGLGLGPLIVAPLSEIYGRNVVYRVSYFLFWVLTWPTAFPPDIATFLVFRFITGFCGSAFLSVAGGSISDLFTNSTVALPMAVYAMSPFLGPVLGPLISGFICQNVDWRWVYRVLLIWQFVMLVLLVFLVPETYAPVLERRKAERRVLW